MLKNYLKTTFRSFRKNKAFVAINTIGLGLAIACCITAYINYDYATSFDKSMENKNHIFRINMERDFQGEITKYAVAPFPLASQIRQNIADVDELVRYYSSGSNFKIEEDVFSTRLVYSDPNFFDVFSFDLIYGNRAGLNEMSNIFISDELSIKYFGTIESLGKQITLILPDRTVEYFVGGVFKKLKLNNSFQFDAITNIDNFLRVDESVSENNWALNLNIFVQIDDLTKMALIESQLQAYKEIQNQAREDLQASRFYLDSFEGIAARSQEERIRNNDLHRGLPKAAVVAPSIMALILLLIACFNFTNTSIAISSRRLKEIGIRKVLGSQRRQLIFQFLTENILICFLGLLTGLVLAEFIIPAYSNMWPFLELEINYLENLDFFIFMIVLLLFTGVFSGGYPAFYISSFQPTKILKGNASFAGTNLFTKTLLFLQYTSCILALILGFAFMENAKYQQEMDFGYETHGILSHELNSEADFEKYRNALIQNPDILHVTGSRHHIFSNWYNDPIKYETNEVETDMMNVSYDYLETMNIELLEGRNFIKDSETDNQESVIVNEEFVKTFNWKDPIGKKLIWRDSVQLYVVGVIKDFYTRAYFGPISPMMFKFALPEDYRQIIIKTNPGNIMAVNEFAEKEYRKTFPNYLYKGQIMDKELEDSAQTNINIVKLFFFLAIIALILTTIGLYSLVSLNILKRMKEIGVRKVMGASVSHIVGKLNKEFIIILSLSSLAGIPLAYKVTDIFMALIWEYYQSPSVLTISLSVLLLFVVSGITLGTKVLSAARSNPVNVLRIS